MRAMCVSVVGVDVCGRVHGWLRERGQITETRNLQAQQLCCPPRSADEPATKH